MLYIIENMIYNKNKSDVKI